MRDSNDMTMIKDLESMVKMLARQRAMMIKTHVMTEEEMTEFLNEKGTKYADKYGSMKPHEIIIELASEVMEKIVIEEG